MGFVTESACYDSASAIEVGGDAMPPYFLLLFREINLSSLGMLLTQLLLPENLIHRLARTLYDYV